MVVLLRARSSPSAIPRPRISPLARCRGRARMPRDLIIYSVLAGGGSGPLR